VTDIFYLHERGEKVSIYGLSVLGGNEVGPLVSAYIIQSLSVRWAFFIVAISIFINQITLVFYMPETKYTGSRPEIIVTGRGVEERGEKEGEGEVGLENEKGAMEGQEEIMGVVSNTIEVQTIEKKGYWNSLAFCTGNDRTVSLWRTFLRPIVLMSYPTVVWSSIIYGISIGVRFTLSKPSHF